MTKRKPQATNQLPVKALYKERQFYARNVLTPAKFRNVIDFWNSRFKNFGKVNLRNQLVRLDTRFLKVIKSPDKNETFYGINFVVDAFHDLQEYCLKAGPNSFGHNAIPENSKFLKLQPDTQNQWEPLDTSYKNHLKAIFTPFVTDYLQAPQYKKRVKNITNFIDMYLQLSLDLGESVSLTRTGFQEGTFCSPNSNGFMIEVGDLTAHDDDKEKDKWISDPGFQFFLRGCAMHGFYVDRNAPWRIVANLESKKMAGYMKKYNIESLKQLFDVYFVKTYMDDVEQLRENIFSFYQSYIRFEPSYDDPWWCAEGSKTMPRRVWRENLSKEEFFIKYGDKYWMRIWFILRCRELGLHLTKRDQKAVITTAYKIKKELDFEPAMDYLSNIISHRRGLGGPPEKSFVERKTNKQVIVNS